MSLTRCAVCYGKANVKRCDRCKSCGYCSKACQTADWPSHKILCRAVTEMPPRPSKDHLRALFFPPDSKEPQFVWIPHAPYPEDLQAPLDPTIQPDRETVRSFVGCDLGGEYIRINPRLKKVMPRILYMTYGDNFENDGSILNRGIAASVKTHGRNRRGWKGPLLATAMSVQGGEEHTMDDMMMEGLTGGGKMESDDFTLADFRSVIDYTIAYGTR